MMMWIENVWLAFGLVGFVGFLIIAVAVAACLVIAWLGLVARGLRAGWRWAVDALLGANVR